MDNRTSRSGPRITLVGLELVIAANAIYGGIGLIHHGMGMPDEWLTATPFASWRWPGVFLLLVIALPMSVAAALEAARSRWAFAASLAAAAAQVGWIGVQWAVLRRYFFLQPVLLCAGLAVGAIAWWLHRGQRIFPPARPQGSPSRTGDAASAHSR